jgi:hypothetical protein
MTREFIYFRIFDKSWSEMGLTDDYLTELENSIIENPNIGKVIQGTGGVRKMRFVLPDNNKGKSGGARVLYVDYISYEKTLLLNAYSKSAKVNITNKEKKLLKIEVEKYLKELKNEKSISGNN